MLETRSVIGAGEVEREPCLLGDWVRGGDDLSITKGELLAVESVEPRT